MLLIPCPYCGPRNDVEFSPGGEAHIARPDPGVSDPQWGEYLYFRKNIKGPQLERWFHAHGCRRWFNVARDSVTHEIKAVYKMGASVPKAFDQLPPDVA
jgi:heterotetrameric sarcosine oxidase delta subunit